MMNLPRMIAAALFVAAAHVLAPYVVALVVVLVVVFAAVLGWLVWRLVIRGDGCLVAYASAIPAAPGRA